MQRKNGFLWQKERLIRIERTAFSGRKNGLFKSKALGDEGDACVTQWIIV